MNRGILLGVVVVIIAVAVAVAVGTNAYQAGLARGLAESGKLPAPGTGGVPYFYYGPFWYHGPFGFGFFGFLFPLLFLFLIFGLFRGLFWGRPWAGHHGPWKGDVPPRFEEWHRRAHESSQERGQKI